MRGSCTIRKERFEILRDQLRSSDDLVQRQMGTVMASFQQDYSWAAMTPICPRDNLDLERLVPSRRDTNATFMDTNMQA